MAAIRMAELSGGNPQVMKALVLAAAWADGYAIDSPSEFWTRYFNESDEEMGQAKERAEAVRKELGVCRS